MTPEQHASSVMSEIRELSPVEQEKQLASVFALCWLKGWVVCQAQMIAAGELFHAHLASKSFLDVTGPKTAAAGVKSFVDGIKGAEKPDCVL
jgi:hypothetical protein